MVELLLQLLQTLQAVAAVVLGRSVLTLRTQTVVMVALVFHLQLLVPQ